MAVLVKRRGRSRGNVFFFFKSVQVNNFVGYGRHNRYGNMAYFFFKLDRGFFINGFAGFNDQLACPERSRRTGFVSMNFR